MAEGTLKEHLSFTLALRSVNFRSENFHEEHV